MAGYENFHQNQIRHMEMIQAVIARLAGNSFLIKGWAVTLTLALLGFAVNTSNGSLATAAFVPVLVFGLLDAYYLRTERAFRALYNRVAGGTDVVEPFFMAATSATFLAKLPANEKSWRTTILSRTVFGFYLILAVTTALVVASIVCSHHH